MRYLDGKLAKCASPAGDTISWLKKTWRDFYDLTYFSANPSVNSEGLKGGFDARRRFAEVVDVWRFGWSDDLSTVPPWEVNLAVEGLRRGQSIVHYMQPHGPWIGRTRLTVSGTLQIASVADVLRRLRGMYRIIDPRNQSLLKEAYRDNLRLVLKHVANLIPALEGKIVITSDHGEALGEHGLFLHPPPTPTFPI